MTMQSTPKKQTPHRLKNHMPSNKKNVS